MRFICVGLVLATLSVLVCAQSPNDLYKKCDAAYGKGNYADAVKACTKAIEGDKTNVEAMMTRAAAYEKLGNDTAAISDYSELIRGGGTAMLHFYRAGLYQKNAKTDAAIADLTASIQKEPAGRFAARSYYQRGLIYDQLGRTNEAQDDYWSASKLDRNLAGLKDKLKYPFGDLTLTEATDRIIPGVVTPVVTSPQSQAATPPPATPKPVIEPPPPAQSRPVSPSPVPPSKPVPVKPVEPVTAAVADPGAWIKAMAAGTARLTAKDYAGAIKFYSECLSHAPGAVLCLKNRAMTYYFLKKYEPALSDIDAAIKTNPDAADFYSIRAFIRFNNDDALGASVDMDRAVKLEPENPEWYANRAIINCKIKEFAFLAKDDEAKARELGGKIAKPCKP